MADWQQSLDRFFNDANTEDTEPKLSAFERFIQAVALPAFEELRPAFEKHGRTVLVRNTPSSAILTVSEGNNEEIMFSIQERTLPDRKLPFAQVRMRERGGLKRVTIETMLKIGDSDYHIEDIAKEDIIKTVLHHYMSRVKLTR